MLALAAQFDWEIEQLDVKTAFLHGDLEEKIYMEQPEGFEVPGKEHMVCMLKKSLYRLKQSSRMWYKTFDDQMGRIGFLKSQHDNCVYLKMKDGAPIVFLLLYVDDMLIAGQDKNEIHKVKLELKSRFEMKDLGGARRILGMDIIRDREKKSIWLIQGDYVKKILGKFQMMNSKAVSTPLAHHFKLSASQSPRDEDQRKEMNKIPYANIVGSIMYTMVCTRPDVSHAMSVVSRYMADPGIDHWHALKWLMRYLKGAADVGLLFQKVEAIEGDVLEGFCDSDYATNLDNRKSQSAHVFNLFGAAVSWKSSLQSVVALSTTEAECISLTEAVKEGIWLIGMLGDFGIKQQKVVVHCDSSSAIHLAKHQVFHERSKHIDVRLHFIRDKVEEGLVKIVKISTEHNPADMLMKSLPTSKFKHCMKLVGLMEK